jgi:hypothetical protein
MNSVNSYFEDLLMKVLEGVASEEEFTTFSEIVRQDAELRQRYVRDMRAHALLSCLQEELRGGEVLKFQSSKVLKCSGSKVLKLETWYSKWMKSGCWKMAASVAVTVLGVWAFGKMGLKPEHIAVLKMVSGDVSVMNGGAPVKVSNGKKIYSGNEVVVSGKESTAVLVWTDGSTMRLTEGARLLLLRDGNAKKIALLTGCFEGDFTKQEKGGLYSILTFQGRATVLGTSLRISTDSQDTRLSVVEGKVRFASPSDGNFEDVSSRYEVTVPTDNKEKFVPTRFYWADRFSGGVGAGAAAQELSIAKEIRRRAEARFHGQ